MISAPDIYLAAKTEKKALMDSLEEDMRELYITTSTKMNYNADNLDVQVIHDAGSMVVKEKLIQSKAPVHNGSFETNEENEAFLQAVFDTKDNIHEILKVLRRFGKPEIYLWTPSQESREREPSRCVQLGFGHGGLDVDAFYGLGYVNGLSRGVTLGLANQHEQNT